MEKKPLLISIDFEDIYNDYLFRLNLSESYIVRENLLYEAYCVIKKILNKYFEIHNLTFFTTGILAEKTPELIKEISKDGNEIACHHYLQENLLNKSKEDFEKELIKSKLLLSKASEQEVTGYRAPNFYINANIGKYLKLVFDHFDYDSSIFFDLKNDKDFMEQINRKSKKEYFCYTKNYFFLKKKIRIKTGGTYFRILTKKMIKKFLENAANNEITPIVYLHPYDFMNNKEFWIELDKFKNLNYIKKYYCYFRQFQWHSLGNKTVEGKLKYISKYFKHKGNMRDF